MEERNKKESSILENAYIIPSSCESADYGENTGSGELSAIAAEELNKLKEEVYKLKIDNEHRKKNQVVRICLIIVLSILSISWLYFTGYEIRHMAKLKHFLPPSVAIAFITSSLGTVVGLWAIGLNYFFHHE